MKAINVIIIACCTAVGVDSFAFLFLFDWIRVKVMGQAA